MLTAHERPGEQPGKVEWVKIMNISKMLNDGGNTVFMLTGSDLKEFALSLLAEARQQAQEKKEEDVYLSEDEVRERLGVTHSTLWRWSNSGYLRPCKWGRKNMWKESDIEKLTQRQQ